MKITLSAILILTIVSCCNSPDDKLVVDTMRMSNIRLDKANEDNLRDLKFHYLENPEKLDSIYQLVFILRDKSTCLKQQILKETTPTRVINEKLLDFENYITSLNLDRRQPLSFDLFGQNKLHNELSRVALVNHILNIENIAQDEIRSSYTITDLKMLPNIGYTINSNGKDSVQVFLNSSFFQKIEDLDVEVAGMSKEDYQIKRPYTFSQLFFTDSTFYENDSLTIRMVGRYLSNYVDTTIKINTSVNNK